MQHLILLTLLNLGLGALLGLAGGLLGIGGGLIAIPLLGYFYGMDQHLAQGTALVMIAPNVLIGFIRYRQRHHFPLRGVAFMCLFSTVATWMAARLATGMDAHTLHLAFAAFLVALALYFGLRPLLARWSQPGRGDAVHNTQNSQNSQSSQSSQSSDAGVVGERRLPPAALPLLGIASGAMSGIFTVGGGLVLVPALVSGLRMAQARAQGMALALVVPGALVALLTYAQAGNVSWSTGLPLAAGGMLSVSTGVMLAHRCSEAALRLLFSLVLLATAALMLMPA